MRKDRLYGATVLLGQALGPLKISTINPKRQLCLAFPALSPRMNQALLLIRIFRLKARQRFPCPLGPGQSGLLNSLPDDWVHIIIDPDLISDWSDLNGNSAHRASGHGSEASSDAS